MRARSRRLAPGVFAVVEQHQDRAVAEHVRKRYVDRHTRVLCDATHVGDCAPSGQSPSATAAVSSASRVLPAPPAPVRVRRRARPSSVRTSPSSRSRPTKLVSCTGSVRRLTRGARPGGVIGRPTLLALASPSNIDRVMIAEPGYASTQRPGGWSVSSAVRIWALPQFQRTRLMRT